MRLLFFSLTILVFGISCNSSSEKDYADFSPVYADDNLTWYSIEDAEKLLAVEKKKILVDVYTSWCGWCKVMDRNTFTDPKIIEYLNKNYHLIKFDAEDQQATKFKGNTFKFVNQGRRGVNQLAIELLNGRLGYPSLVYFDENLKKIKISSGYKDPAKLMTELKEIRT